MKTFNDRVSETLFNIYTQDKSRHSYFENILHMKMEKQELDFLEDQSGERRGFCEEFVDRKWERNAQLSKIESKTLESSQIEHTSDLKHNCDSAVDSAKSYLNGDVTNNSKICESTNLCGQEILNNIGQMICNSEEMPEKWAHLRMSDGKLRPDFDDTIDKLMNVYQCTKYQAISAVITVGIRMFDRKWKHYDSDIPTVDKDMAPDVKVENQSSIEKTIEFVALKCILEEIVELGEAHITFHQNSSNLLSIQSITLNEKTRTFPKISFAKDSRENLKDMKLAVLNSLSVYGGITPDDLAYKVTFSLSDDAANDNEIVETQVALEVARYTIDDKRTDNISNHFSEEQFDLIIDVRSPGEFKLDHIPRATNFPVLNNEERCKVGTIYSGKKHN